ncbi:MAG: hypothetical protein HYY23_20630, partial [Verrucomicrobia bacterium]|nr:hypothetical protein [Verrucomicrobiota bacterium]
GIARTCRSYYMLQQVQARYGLKAPTRIAYWDGAQLVSVSDALLRDLPRTRRQLFVEYPGGLRLWLNDHPKENWRVPSAERGARNAELTLPPAGWAATANKGELFSYSAWDGTNRVDYIRSPEYVYLDGRGRQFDSPEAVSDGALAIRSRRRNELEIIHISGQNPFAIRRPFKISGACVACDAFDAEGKRILSVSWRDIENETRIEPAPTALRYVLQFRKEGKP